MKSNFHTHTRFSDGKGEPEEFVLHAQELGFRHLGFSEHAPVNFPNPWSLKEINTDEYIRTIQHLRQQFAGSLSVYRSLEIDYIPGISKTFAYFKKRFSLDYTLGAVHLVKKQDTETLWFIDGAENTSYLQGLTDVFQNNITEGVSHYYQQQIEMLRHEKPDVLGHFDKVKMHNQEKLFKSDAKWVKKLQYMLIAEARKQGTIVEINTRGIYKKRCHELFPSEHLIHRCWQEGVPMMLSSDAHAPEEIDGHFAETLPLLRSIGVRKLMIFEEGKFVPVTI